MKILKISSIGCVALAALRARSAAAEMAKVWGVGPQPCRMVAKVAIVQTGWSSSQRTPPVPNRTDEPKEK